MDAWWPWPWPWPWAPRTARAAAFTCALALVYGTVVHVVHLAMGGTDPYPSMPRWLAAYFVSLTVLDPLAAVLLLQRRRAGLALGCTVLLTDAEDRTRNVLDAALSPLASQSDSSRTVAAPKQRSRSSEA